MKAEAEFVVQELEKTLREAGALGHATARPVIEVYVHIQGGISKELRSLIHERELALMKVIKSPLHFHVLSTDPSGANNT